MPASHDNRPVDETPRDDAELEAQQADEDQRYRDLMRSIQDEWDALEASGDSSVQLSGKALSTIKESVRADVRRGSPVDMPPTGAGPFTVSELALRSLVRRNVDSIEGAVSLRTTFDHLDGETTPHARGVPARVAARISVHRATADMLALATDVRSAVTRACAEHFGLDDLAVDIHIEDIHG